MAQWYKKIICWFIDISSCFVKTVFQVPKGCCRFYPSCTEFSKEAIEILPMTAAIWEIIKRIFKCHPFCCGGFDPVNKDKYPYERWKKT
jgi:uncharacterized protein